MSLFNAFGHGGFAALTQTLENIGNIVAPIAPNEDESDPNREADDDEENESFDSKVQSFFSNIRDQYQQGGNLAVESDIEPSTPSSFVSVELGTNSPRTGVKSKEPSPRSTDSGSFGYVSGPELEKKVQLKYREQLEDEISSFDRRYSELQSTSARKIQLLEQECAQWKLLADEFKGQNTVGGDDNAEELNTLYEKLGLMTQELEDKEMELAAAQETILALNADSINSNMRELDKDGTLQAQLAEVTDELIELRDKNAAAEEHIQELTEALERAEQSMLKQTEESNAKEEDLINLTKQLRDSNKAIAALEQKLADVEAAGAAPAPYTPDVAASSMVDDLQQRLQELQQRQTEVAEHLRLAEEQNAEIRAAYIALQTENSRLHEESTSLQTQLSASSEAATQFTTNLQAITSDLEQVKEQLHAAGEEGMRLREELAAREKILEEMQRPHAVELENATAAQATESNEETGQLAEKVQSLQAELANVLMQLHSDNEVRRTLATELEALKEEHAETLQDLSIVSGDVEDLRLQLAAAVESKTRAETSELSLNAELEQMRGAVAKVDQAEVIEGYVQARDEALARLLEAQSAILSLQQQLGAKEEEFAERAAELTDLRAQMAAAVDGHEQTQASQFQRIEELNAEVSRFSVELEELVHVRDEAVNQQGALQEQISVLESRLADAVEESSSLQEAMKGLRTQVVALSEERDSALATVQQLESQHAQQATATVQVPVPIAPTNDSPTIRVSKSSSADLDAVVSGAGGENKTGTTTTEEALAASQAEFAKAMKKIKAVNKQLKDRDAEIVKLKEASTAMSAELIALRAQHGGDVAPEPTVAIAESGNDSSGRVSDLETQLASAEFRIQELSIERSELLACLNQMPDLSALQAELSAALARVSELDEALTSSEDALKSTEEVAWHAKAEASELLFAYEQEQACVQKLQASQEALQEEVVRARDILLQNIGPSVHSQGEEGALPLSTLVESALKELRARCEKEAQELIAVQAQRSEEGNELQQLQTALKESYLHALSVEDSLAAKEAEIGAKEAEISRLLAVIDESTSRSEGVEDEVHQKLAQKQQELDLFKEESLNERQIVEALREEAHRRISEVESLLSAKSEELEVARSQIADDNAEMQRVLAAHSRIQAELATAVEKASKLDEALTGSEDALKSTEEVAWHAKAEASELLFAYEQEQARVQKLSAERDALQDQLGSLQAQLAATAEQGASNRIAHLDEVQAQLFSVYHSLRTASDLLRFVDGGGVGSNTTPSKELTTFEHLVTHCGTDLVSPLSMLALISKTQASLADQIMAHLREQSEQLRALQESEQHASVALQEGSKLLATLLRVVKSGSTDEDVPVQAADLVSLARRICQDLNTALNQTEERLFSQSTATEQVTNLQEQLEQANAELALLRESTVREKLASTAQIQQSEARIVALQSEISEHAAQFEDAFRKVSLEKQQVANELQQLQSGSAQYTEQMQTFKSHIQKIETENKQLHQVIAQLRQVRKTTKGESDNAITERDELRAHCVNLQAEVNALQQQLRVFTETEETAAVLRSELNQVTASLAASERHLESTRRALAQVEKELYDKSAELEVTRTDILLIRQELDRRHVELSNLKEAIQQVESERDFYVSRAQRELVDKLKAAQEQAETERKALEVRLSQQLEGERAQRIKLEEARQDHELFHRKAELEFNQEKKKMQRTLENALAQLNNSQQQVIDRMLVANLIVSYFKRRRSVDVLKIIAKVLAFDDEQLIAVGLKVPPIDLIGSLLSTVMGRPAPAPEVKGDNLAEQWINFLIDESDQDASNSAGLVPRARSHSDAVSSSPKANAKMGADVDLSYK